VTLVGISGAYGAGGSRVGPALAERLGVPFLDRAIPAAVADALEVPLDDAAAHDEQLGGTWLERLLRGFVGLDAGAPAALPAQMTSPADFRRATEEVLRAQIATGAGVILGRGAVILLREHPGALRVRLDGPPERRCRQAMRLQGIDEDAAKRRMRRQDRTHLAYAKDFYGCDLRDPSLYHVVLDSTAIELDGCAELLAQAARSLQRAPGG
jgi:cytidylate kinase